MSATKAPRCGVYGHTTADGKRTVNVVLDGTTYEISPEEAHTLGEDIFSILPFECEVNGDLMTISWGVNAISVPMSDIMQAIRKGT